MAKLFLEVIVNEDIDDENCEELGDSLNEITGLSTVWDFSTGCSAADYFSVEEVKTIVDNFAGKKKIGEFTLNRIVIENDFSQNKAKKRKAR